MHSLFGVETTTGLLVKGVIEVAPLAFLVVRTLSDAFVCLDET